MKERGFSIVEFLVTTTIVAGLLSAVVAGFLQTTGRTYDNQIMSRAEEEARTVLDVIAYDIRMAGAGMPMGQASFAMTDATLGDAALPILLSATGSYIQVRTNEVGNDTVLTTSFVPSASTRTFTVLSNIGFEVGDVIYLNDVTQGGTRGLRGTIESISGNNITIQTGYSTSPAASFPSGTLVGRITTVTYNSSPSGITRNDTVATTRLGLNSTVAFTYLDCNGTVLALPLTAAIEATSLCAMNVAVTVTPAQTLKNGLPYTASAEQRVTLRNFILSR